MITFSFLMILPLNKIENKIREQILAFYKRTAGNPNHRYRSWEHCYGHFQEKAFISPNCDIDTAALHLAFYLASWGMYRGSSVLLWKDYKIHQAAVSILLKPDYRELWNINIVDQLQDDKTVNQIVALSNDLRNTYSQQIVEVNGSPRKYWPSDTLITKILLGALACTPACDRFFILGWRSAGFQYTKFNSDFLNKVFQFYRAHDTGRGLMNARDEIFKLGGIQYPIMKLVDMYFWELGYRLLPEAESVETPNEV